MRSPRPTTEPTTPSMEPSQSVEVEITFDVGPETEVPDWTQVPLVVTVAEPEVRELDAVYYDTAEYVLGRAGYALRRREGGPDAGWHLKGPRQGSGRMETGWPLDIGGDTASVTGVPPEIAAHIGDLTTDPLVVIARIRNTRTAYALRDAEGGILAEMVDDRVRTRDEQRGMEQAWREWELPRMRMPVPRSSTRSPSPHTPRARARPRVTRSSHAPWACEA